MTKDLFLILLLVSLGLAFVGACVWLAWGRKHGSITDAEAARMLRTVFTDDPPKPQVLAGLASRPKLERRRMDRRGQERRHTRKPAV